MRRSGMLILVVAALVSVASGAQDVTERMPLQTVIPIYPQRALQDRIQGEVEVCFEVDRAGQTSRIAVRRSTHRLFEKPAIAAIRASTYRALADEQRLTGVKTCRTFRFQLNPTSVDDAGLESDATES